MFAATRPCRLTKKVCNGKGKDINTGKVVQATEIPGKASPDIAFSLYVSGYVDRSSKLQLQYVACLLLPK